MKLEFDESYFREENIQGFTVPEMMKRCWATYQDLLSDFDEICTRNNIPYFADYGTLLGAVRHQDFIPWDDDVDVCMFRKDLIRLTEVMKTELPEGFQFVSRYNTRYRNDMSAYFQNAVNLQYSVQNADRYYGCPYIITIDIFPMDNLPDNEEERSQILLLFNSVYDVAQRYNQYKEEGTLEEYIQIIEDYCQYKIDRSGNVEGQLWFLADSIAMLCGDAPTRNIAYYPDILTSSFKCIKEADWYKNTVRLPFGNITVPAPAEYDKVLRALYGEDYMTPVMGTAFHDYPFYKKQASFLPPNLQ